MAVNNYPKKREGKETVITVGLEQDGNSRLFERTVAIDPKELQHIRDYPDRWIIYFDKTECNGAVKDVRIEWERGIENSAGRVLEGGRIPMGFEMREDDKKEFIARLEDLLFGAANGKTRAIDGYNSTPPFGPTGPITYTVEQENEAPKFGNQPGSYKYDPDTYVAPADADPV